MSRVKTKPKPRVVQFTLNFQRPPPVTFIQVIAKNSGASNHLNVAHVRGFAWSAKHQATVVTYSEPMGGVLMVQETPSQIVDMLRRAGALVAP